MQGFWAELQTQIPESFFILWIAHVLLLATWPLFLLLERAKPIQRGEPRANLLLNWKVIGTNMLITPFFYATSVALSIWAAGALGLPAFPYPLATWSVGVPIVDTVLQAFVLFATAAFLGDAWYYWWHRAQHEWPWLWELHKLHHSDEHLNVVTIYRSHFLELAGQALVRGFTVGLIFDLSGAPDETFVAIFFAGLLPPLWDFFIHANVRLDFLHRLVPFLSTPQYHWIHHSRRPEHQDKNYAIWLPLFDKLFGTYYAARVDEYPPTGLSSGERIETLWHAQAGPFLAWSGRTPYPSVPREST